MAMQAYEPYNPAFHSLTVKVMDSENPVATLAAAIAEICANPTFSTIGTHGKALAARFVADSLEARV